MVQKTSPPYIRTHIIRLMLCSLQEMLISLRRENAASITSSVEACQSDYVSYFSILLILKDTETDPKDPKERRVNIRRMKRLHIKKTSTRQRPQRNAQKWIK